MISRKMLSDSEAAIVFQLHAGGVRRAEISSLMGVPEKRLFDRGLERRGRGTLAHPSLVKLPRRQGKNGGRPRKGREVDPTPEQIRERAAECIARREAKLMDFHTEDGEGRTSREA
jgi:hypothetical protein